MRGDPALRSSIGNNIPKIQKVKAVEGLVRQTVMAFTTGQLWLESAA
ncbi:hypothetical protein MNBD_GAMMA14-1086 [hydrothermal vent metagenome]|uniref:Uncharacterized protein n=1 Tax=hydrothermal vent metagenome TaxID=652676 RepID=A0A3B0YQT3_9ZZZZ